MSAFAKLKNKLFSKKKSKIKITDELDPSKEIDSKMKEENDREQKTIRILLLGPGDSGKTTIIKQIQKTHNEYDPADAVAMRQYIQNSCVNYMKTLCIESQRLYREFKEKTKVNDAFETLRMEFLLIDEACDLTPDLAEKINVLWADDGIKRTLELRHHYQIHDNVAYFLSKIEQIACPDYTPSFQDYVRIRYRSTGFAQTKIIANITNFGQYTFEFIDVGGQRSERKKWMKFISEDIDAIIYVVAVSEYDMKLLENNETNRLHEAIDLFQQILVKGKLFENRPVLLFFNKYDLFKEKIKKVPITVAFKDFPEKEMDPNDDDDVIKFIACKFFNVFQQNQIPLTGPLHVLRTTALDTNHIEKIFSNVTSEIIQHRLEDSGLIERKKNKY